MDDGCLRNQPAGPVSQHPNLAFDISMTDVFGALCHGATLYPLLREMIG